MLVQGSFELSQGSRESSSLLCRAGRWLLSTFVIHAAEMTPGLREKLPPTDSRLRHDLRLLERAVYNEVGHLLCFRTAAEMTDMQLELHFMLCCWTRALYVAVLHGVSQKGLCTLLARQTLQRWSWRSWTGRTAQL